ncbi:MAG TPA: DUF1294 domain-containing protein [Gemmatimonadales bacterium]|nr:DUF1294 domain-containing protein [Gemmatimonadales bacterium]
MTAGRATRLEGTLASWNDERGFGFIRPADSAGSGGRNVFVHIKAFPVGVVRPEVGEPLTFEVELSPDGRQRAARVERAGMEHRRDRGVRYRSARQDLVSYLALAAFLALFALVSVRWALPSWVAALYVGVSVLCFVSYASDKSAARSGRWRMSESALLSLGLIGGWPGAIIAQQVLRHKTKKATFQRAFWGTVLLNVVVFVLLAWPGSTDVLVGWVTAFLAAP